MIATRNIIAGECIISESPLIMWRSPSFTDEKQLDFCERHKVDPSCLFGPMAMLRAPSDVQAKLMALYPGEPDSTLPSLSSVPLVAELGVTPAQADQLQRYLRIIQFNAFSIVAGNGARAGEGNDQALYDTASMFSHSCIPNCYYHSLPPDEDGHGGGQRRVFAIKNVKQGEELTVSYVDPALLMEPHHRRAAKLMRGKVIHRSLSLIACCVCW